MKRFCPKCGRQENGRETFIKGFCKKCFLEDHSLASMPEKIGLPKCKRCSKVLYKGRWIAQEEALEKAGEAAVKASPEMNDARVTVKIEGEEVKAEVIGRVGDSIVRTPFSSVIKFTLINCTECQRLSSGYHEAIIQLRYAKPSRSSTQEYVREARYFLKHVKTPLAVLVDFEELKTGIDLLVGSAKAGKALAEYFSRNKKITTSKKLIGKDKKTGKDRYRFTYLVRL